MNNQELLAKIEEWVDEHEEGIYDSEDDVYSAAAYMVPSESLITFIKKLLHE